MVPERLTMVKGKYETKVRANILPGLCMHVHMYMCSVAQLCPTFCNSMNYNPPGCSVHGFFRQEYWSRLLFSPSEDLPTSLASSVLAGRLFTAALLQCVYLCVCVCVCVCVYVHKYKITHIQDIHWINFMNFFSLCSSRNLLATSMLLNL